MNVTNQQIRSYRLRAHHLDEKIPAEEMLRAVSVCGLQNTPPGAWETALFQRIAGCTSDDLQDALYKKKTLLQAWSFRGVPAVFPANESSVFLAPLVAEPDEQPWIYTRGITGALEHMQMPFDDLLARVKEAALYLDSHTIKSKEALDQTLADIVEKDLPEDKQRLWQSPSMYGNPDRQTVGGAAVSFLLRPCSFHSLVVFGERQDNSPAFTSFKNWTGHMPEEKAEPEKLMRKFIHCYGPTTLDCFMSWLGCTKKQAKRLWNSLPDELVPVEAEGKKCFMLAEDMESLLSAETDEKLLLLGPHDPYLDLRDRTVILENKAFHKKVWQFVSNPGAVLKGGRIIGIWKAKKNKGQLEVLASVWEPIDAREKKRLEELAEEYAEFRKAGLRSFGVDI